MALLPKLTSMIRSYDNGVTASGSGNSGGGGRGIQNGGGLHARAALSCVRVLSAVAARAPWAAARVASEAGLLKAVREVRGRNGRWVTGGGVGGRGGCS